MHLKNYRPNLLVFTGQPYNRAHLVEVADWLCATARGVKVFYEVFGDGVGFTTIHMPLVKTPMIAPTKIYDAFPTITPAQAADMVLEAMVEKPHELNTVLGTLGAVAHTLAPKTTFRVLHMAYQVFPDSAAARGDEDDTGPTSEQLFLARLLKGVHW